MRGFASKRFVWSALALGLLAISSLANGGDLSLPLNGSVLGTVEDAQGAPQIGASVQLFNKFERLIAKTMTGSDGRFAFAGLPSDFYSVRVSVASYFPVTRDRIAVRAGFDSLLRVHVASLLSNMEVTYAVPTAAMSDDWKWVLRSSPATRAMTRFLPAEVSTSPNSELFPRIFSGTHAMVSLSGGDSSILDADSGQADMGTGFIVSTNFLGKNLLQLGGNYAQSMTSGPSALALVAIYSRDHVGSAAGESAMESPEVTFSVSQLGLAGGSGIPGSNLSGGMNGTSGGISAGGLTVRTMSIGIYQTFDPLDDVHFEYGMTGESVDAVQHTSRISPFARMTVSAGKLGKILAAYSNGGRPDELTDHQPGMGLLQAEGDSDLSAVASTLTRLPQLSYANDRMVLQRTLTYEMGYQKISGSRTYAVSAFNEDTSNGRVNVAGNTDVLPAGNLLSDGVSKTLIYNIGSYKRNGALASVTQDLGGSTEVAAAYGRMGGFTTQSNFEPRNSLLDERDRNVANMSFAARLPGCGTKVRANYGWVANGAIVPSHVFTTQNIDVMPGLNILVRQPLPSLFGMPGHLELTADVRNILAQGYLPVATGGDGHNLLLVQSPRGLRGGLNFIF